MAAARAPELLMEHGSSRGTEGSESSSFPANLTQLVANPLAKPPSATLLFMGRAHGGQRPWQGKDGWNCPLWSQAFR